MNSPLSSRANRFLSKLKNKAQSKQQRKPNLPTDCNLVLNKWAASNIHDAYSGAKCIKSGNRASDADKAFVQIKRKETLEFSIKLNNLCF